MFQLVTERHFVKLSEATRYPSILAVLLLLLALYGILVSAQEIMNTQIADEAAWEEQAEKWVGWLAAQANYSEEKKTELREDLSREWRVAEQLSWGALLGSTLLGVFAAGLLYRRNWGRLGVATILTLVWLQTAVALVLGSSVLDREIVKLQGWHLYDKIPNILFLIVLGVVLVDLWGARVRAECDSAEKGTALCQL